MEIKKFLKKFDNKKDKSQTPIAGNWSSYNLPPGRVFIFFKNSSWSHAWIIHVGKWIKFLSCIWSTTFSKYKFIKLSTISDLVVINFSCVVRFRFYNIHKFHFPCKLNSFVVRYIVDYFPCFLTNMLKIGTFGKL